MVEIKKLVPEQWEIMKQLRLQALEADGVLFDSSLAETRLLSNEQWRAKIAGERNIVLAVFEDSAPVGMVRAFWGICERKEHVACVRGLYVSQECRSEGVGRKLMQQIIAEIEKINGIRKIQLEVVSELANAIKLYESFGFEIVGTLQKELCVEGTYYDKYVMEKIISK